MNLGPKILDRYIIRKFLGTYVFAILIIIVIVIVFDLAENLQQFMDAHISLKKMMTGYYLNFIPYFINQFSALFTFISVIFFTSKMAYDTEIIAILSSGVSFKRLMWPYFISSFIIAVGSLLLSMFVIPRTQASLLAFNTEYEYRQKEQKLEPYVYRQIEPGTFVYIRNYNNKTSSASYLALETYNEGRIVKSVEAAGVSFDKEKGRWTAPRYITRDFDGEIENFVKHDQPLDTVINLIDTELGKVEDLVRTLNSIELVEFIDQQKRKGSDMVVTFQVENHSRYAYSVASFILTLIGVSLSSRKVRGGTGLHIGVGIGLCFSYIVLMKFTGEFAKSGVMSAWLAVWLPNIIYTIIGIYLYIKAPK